MKKIFLGLALLMTLCQTVQAQAVIKFEKTSHSYGKFSAKSGAQKCEFTFTNTGDKPLLVTQAVASCGCTVPTFTKKPVMPGQTGKVNVTYNGAGKFPGHFRKTVTLRTNGTPEVVRLSVEGEMTE